MFGIVVTIIIVMILMIGSSSFLTMGHEQVFFACSITN